MPLNTLPSASSPCMSSGDLQCTSMQAPAPAFYAAPAPFQASSSYFFSGYEPFCDIYCNAMHAAAPPLYVGPTPSQATPSSPAPPLLSPIAPRHPTSSSPAPPLLSPSLVLQHTYSSPAPPPLSPIAPCQPICSPSAPPLLSQCIGMQVTASSPAPPLLSPVDPRHPAFSSPAPPPLSPNAPCHPTPSFSASPLSPTVVLQHTSPAPPPLSPIAARQPTPSSPAPALPSQYPLSLNVTPAPSLNAPTPFACPSNATFPISSFTGTTRSFTFYRAWANKTREKYGCIHCLKERRKRGEQTMGEYIEVDFEALWMLITLVDTFQELQSIRRDPTCAEKKPVKVYLDMVAASFVTDDVEMEDSIRAAVRRSGYHARRQPIVRSLAVWKNRAVTMDNVPSEFRTLRDGSTFLHYQAPGFHIYYSIATIQKACEAGLHSIVADGMHSLHPRSLGCHAQLYCVHGVCSGGIEVPLMYCITAKKTEETYLKVFGHLKSNITGDAPRRAILDFEKAAITATRKIFPRASVEGCAFHLAQAWNRRRDALGLRRYMQGMERDARIVQWWDTVKGTLKF
ncbi:hypothetical protein TELCIR_16876 [Teladorsagia circumcincta]|uniref:MULE transposase domain-containing protein n=1 Tax=Teladorsagia circumcincta TaxID=45464 RepID=A0A2G9TUJ4_TELCI|nr:hypothetical protein TELCIR_16876 [Teladorsagia circumcincta]